MILDVALGIIIAVVVLFILAMLVEADQFGWVIAIVIAISLLGLARCAGVSV